MYKSFTIGLGEKNKKIQKLKLYARGPRGFYFISFHSSKPHLQNRLMAMVMVMVVVLLDITL
jgi:hypothetical protein